MPRIRMATAAGLAAAAISIALAGCGSSSSFSAHPAWLTSQEPASARPGYFIDNEATSPYAGYGWSEFAVRQAASGHPVAEGANHLDHRVTAVAAIGLGRAFVMAEEAPNSCASQLYWFRLDSRGRVGKPTAIGPEFDGEVNSLAASADGRTIAYTLSGCTRGNRGYLKVLDARTGNSRQWTSVDLTDDGSLGLASDLSLSADGKLLAFVGWSPDRDQAAVRVLATRARTGDLADRSTAVLRLPVTPDGLEPEDAIAISPAGTAFYLCTVSTRAGSQVTSVASYSTGSGQLLKQVLQLSAKDPGTGHPLPGCAMSVSQGGGYALVPFAVSYPGPGSRMADLSVASIDLAGGVPAATFSFPVRQDTAIAGPGAADVSISW